MKLIKKPIPNSIEEYLVIRKNADNAGYRWTNDALGHMIFEQKRSKSKIEGAKTPEWEEFIKLYRTINKNGSYADTLIRKYEIVLTENKHSDIMKNLKEYIEHIDAYKKPPLQAGTYLNQKRYLDPWETVKVDFTTKWIDDILKERQIPSEVKEVIMIEVGNWKATHGNNPSMEFTTFKLDAIIDKYYKPSS